MDKINGKTPEEIKRGLIEAMEEATWVVEGGDAHDLIDAVEIAHEKMAHALGYIQQLEAQVPRWVSVSEAVPGETGSYIVCTDKGAVCTARFYGEDGFFQWVDGRNVTHWMPLPKAPKEG